MPGLATGRLIDAASALAPADRALLNLWVNRGLDDARLIGLTGMSIEALQRRRENIVAGLAAELALPAPDVRAALEQISHEQTAPAGVPANGGSSNGVTAPAGTPHGVSAPPAAPPTPVPVAPETTEPTQPETQPPAAVADLPAAPAAEVTTADTPVEPAAGRRRWWWLALGALVLILGAVIAAVVSSGSSSPVRRAVASSPSTSASTPTQTPTVASPHPTAGPVPAPFLGLPGGLARASGSVRLAGPIQHLKLNLTVRGLPAPHAGHYEVWLYNSVLDSRPLARLRIGQHALIARLPADARRFHWIDVSFQPVGVVFHSGESELRASNPAHATRARLRRPAARARHRLREAAKVSATARHSGRHHSRRRTTRGSRNVKTSK